MKLTTEAIDELRVIAERVFHVGYDGPEPHWDSVVVEVYGDYVFVCSQTWDDATGTSESVLLRCRPTNVCDHLRGMTRIYADEDELGIFLMMTGWERKYLNDGETE